MSNDNRLDSYIKKLQILQKANIGSSLEIQETFKKDFPELAHPQYWIDETTERNANDYMSPFRPVKGSDTEVEINPTKAAKWLEVNLQITTTKEEQRKRLFYSERMDKWLNKDEVSGYFYQHINNNAIWSDDTPKLLDKSIDFLVLLVANSFKPIQGRKVDLVTPIEKRYIVENLIRTKTTSLFYGKSGAGKTAAICKMCADIKIGNTVFEQLSHPEMSIHYLSFEMTDEDFQEMFDAIGIDRFNQPFEIELPERGVYSTEQIIDYIEQVAPEADMIILDNLWAFSDASPYSPEEIVAYIMRLTDYAVKANKHIMICHHSSKMNYGSGANKATADNASGSAQLQNPFSTSFEAREENGNYYVTITKLRGWSGLKGKSYDMFNRVMIDPKKLSLKEFNQAKKEKAEAKANEIIEIFSALDIDNLSSGEVKQIISDQCGCSMQLVQKTLKENGIKSQRIDGNLFRYQK